MDRFRKILLVLLGSLQLAACAASGPLLNSDRIQDKFGSYGVDIVQEDAERRISSLYSGAGDTKVTRTYAIVEYLGDAKPEFRTEHAAIVGGASIGATFRRSGWMIRKQNMFIEALEVPAEYAGIGRLMQTDLPATMAIHQYLFVISKEERSFSYARITELHHPDFASLADLHRWYGEIILDDSNRDSLHDFIGPPLAK